VAAKGAAKEAAVTPHQKKRSQRGLGIVTTVALIMEMGSIPTFVPSTTVDICAANTVSGRRTRYRFIVNPM
jgi:hypothetical protein